MPSIIPYNKVSKLCEFEVDDPVDVFKACLAVHREYFTESYEFDMVAENGVFQICSDEEGFNDQMECFIPGHVEPAHYDLDKHGYPLQANFGEEFGYAKTSTTIEMGEEIKQVYSKIQGRGGLINI